MSEQQDALDEKLRRRIAQLGDDVPAPLDADSQRRVLRALHERTARQARSRAVWWLGGAGLAAAAAALLLVLRSPPDTRRSQDERAACSLPSDPQSTVFVRRADGRFELALGRFGRMVAAESAQVRVRATTPCELAVELGSGELAAEVHGLTPGALRVQTRFGDVVVHGTRFSVRVQEELEVVLLSGVVTLQDGTAPSVQLPPQRMLHRAAAQATPRVEPVDARRRAGLEQLLSVQPVEPRAAAAAPATTDENAQPESLPARAGDLLGQVERQRRLGDLAGARALYRRASARGQANAEVALLRWTRFELDLSDVPAAEALLLRYERSYPAGRLRAEAGWLGVQTQVAKGDTPRARTLAHELVSRFPGTPQAQAAAQLLQRP